VRKVTEAAERAGGIDVVEQARSLWVRVRSAAADLSGVPTMEALRRVDARRTR
jgi:hypothetical protein